MSPTRWLAYAAFALLPIALANIPAEPSPGTRDAADGPKSLFAETVPATNPTRLHLQIDQNRLLGWVSGDEDFAGREAVISHGDKRTAIAIGADNTFTWELPERVPEGGAFGVQVGDYGRHHYRPDRRHFRACTPQRAANKAERYGVRRARVIDVDRRTITVAGHKWGERVRMTFGRSANCPIVRW